VILPFDYGDVRYFRMARTVLGRAVYWTGVYLVDGLLVDSGPPTLAREVRRLVGELAVRRCVTTHHHEDHTGNHGLLAAELGITPLAHASALPRLAEADPHFQLYRRVAWGRRRAAPAARLGDRLETTRFRFQVIHTPGHAADHVALFEPERAWLFSGDLYLATRLRYLRADEDVYAMMESLRRVLTLEPQVLFCQHRGRVEHGAARLRDKLDFLVELDGRIHDLHGRGWSEAAIARALPGSDVVWRIWTAGDFSKRNFVKAFLRRPPPAPP
jgi:glyoxylase-like metal-dependent hydrolase (beta-lactamase superfamily II)